MGTCTPGCEPLDYSLLATENVMRKQGETHVYSIIFHLNFELYRIKMHIKCGHK